MPIQKTTKKTATTTRTRTKKETASSQLALAPKLRDSRGNELPLTIDNIFSVGKEAGEGLSKISDAVLSKVKVADTGEFSDGITNILSLTRKVDITRLGKVERGGIMAKVWNIFGDTRQKVVSQFETSAEQIDRICENLEAGIDRMRGESEWLNDSYEANIAHLYDLEALLESVVVVKDYQDKQLEEIVKVEDTPMDVLDKQRLLCESLDKQADKLRRLIQLAKLTAPQIVSLKKVNINSIEKFNSINSITIPAWKQHMSLGLISVQQQKDIELANQIDDVTNDLLKGNAKRMAKNMKDSALANQRGVVDIDTLESIQNDMLSGIKEAINIENNGRKERSIAAEKIAKMDKDLKVALRDLGKK